MSTALPAPALQRPTEPLLPPDARLLPLSRGHLLVSREYALFCAVPPEQVEAVSLVLARAAGPASLEPGLLAELRRHGFGGPPRQAEPESPSVQLQLTNACNLACAYCCTNSGTARASEVGLDELRAVVEQAAAVLGPRTRVSLLGGEPLLVPWSLELAAEVLDQGLVLTLFSNGLKLGDPEVARRVAALCRRGCELRISLAGPTAGLCDGLSGAPRFQAALAGLHELARQGGSAVVDLMLLPSQVEAVAAHLPALRRLLPAGTSLALGLAYLGGREQGEHLFRSRAALEAALDRIAFAAGEAIAASAPSPLAYRREGCACALGEHLHVRSDGALFTCFKMEEQVGHLRHDRFAEVLGRVRAQPHPARQLPFCESCPLATLCGGGCRTENLQITGDADRPVCGEWRVRVICELLAEDRVSALDWPADHLLAEAHARGIAAPAALHPAGPSRHLLEV